MLLQRRIRGISYPNAFSWRYSGGFVELVTPTSSRGVTAADSWNLELVTPTPSRGVTSKQNQLAERVGFAPSLLARTITRPIAAYRDYHAGAYDHALWHARLTARSHPTRHQQKNRFLSESACFFVGGGESGIRTHVGLHPNGFQDRPVMTASVSLHVWQQTLAMRRDTYCHVIISHALLVVQPLRGDKYCTPPIYGRRASGISTVPSAC